MSEMATEERWLPVPGHEGAYEVSDMGRVRSLDRVIEHGGGSYFKPGRVLRLGVASGGYLNVSLGKAGGTRLVHQLVPLAFLGPKPAGAQVRHLNGDRRDNRLANLSYGTAKENAADSAEHGTRPRGERRFNHKLREADIPFIRQRIGRDSDSAIARDHGVDPAAIRHIRLGRSWSHV